MTNIGRLNTIKLKNKLSKVSLAAWANAVANGRIKRAKLVAVDPRPIALAMHGWPCGPELIQHERLASSGR
jgi:hypothetical protein